MIIFIIRCSPWIIKFGLTSWPIRGLLARMLPYSIKSKREYFVLLLKANVGKTVALIGLEVSCLRTSPAEIARLGLPNAGAFNLFEPRAIVGHKKYWQAKQ